MKLTFIRTLTQLKQICNKYDPVSNESKIIFLNTLKNKPIPVNNSCTVYLNVLLYICAHPSDTETLFLAEHEVKRLSSILKKAKKKDKDRLQNSGLPYTTTLSIFTHELLEWLIEYQKTEVTLDSFYKSKISLSEALSLTLPSLEKEYTSMSSDTKGLFEILHVHKADRLTFLVSEFSKLKEVPLIKDYFFSRVQMFVKLIPKDEFFSKAYNRLPIATNFFHDSLHKQFNTHDLLNSKLPPQKKLTKNEFTHTISVIKNSLTLLQRETDPVTFMDKNSFRLFDLERGISVAIYGMYAERQLPLESYVGYTLFKNGYPAAYGGAWIFGKRSLFGINIFEPYRGGESGFMMCQLLRVYRQAFGVDYFEVEPYQYGQGNPEGISSGAYWFYYRFGFRSLQPELNKLASKEFELIKQNKGYRSTEDTLIRFTESNVALQMGKGIPLTVAEVRDKVTAHIAEKYAGNRVLAEQEIIKRFLNKVGKSKIFTQAEKKVLSETAVMAEVLNIHTASKIKLLYQMVLTKPSDLYTYQKLLKVVLE